MASKSTIWAGGPHLNNGNAPCTKSGHNKGTIVFLVGGYLNSLDRQISPAVLILVVALLSGCLASKPPKPGGGGGGAGPGGAPACPKCNPKAPGQTRGNPGEGKGTHGDGKQGNEVAAPAVGGPAALAPNQDNGNFPAPLFNPDGSVVNPTVVQGGTLPGGGLPATTGNGNPGDVAAPISERPVPPGGGATTTAPIVGAGTKAPTDQAGQKIVDKPEPLGLCSDESSNLFKWAKGATEELAKGLIPNPLAESLPGNSALNNEMIEVLGKHIDEQKAANIGPPNSETNNKLIADRAKSQIMKCLKTMIGQNANAAAAAAALAALEKRGWKLLP